MSETEVSRIEVTGQQCYEGTPFPTAYSPSGDVTIEQAINWVDTERDTLDAQLTEAGTLLFRGFPLANAEDFDRFVTAFRYPNFTYAESLSNAVRVNKTERVFTANEAPSTVRIHFHHEMAQTPIYPSRLFFFCQQPADSGGATPLCRSDVLLDRLREVEPQFVADCEAKGLKYSNVMPGADDASSGMGRSWQSTFGTDAKAGAESKLAGLGYSWEWLDGDCLRATTPVLPAVRELSSGRSSFFNQLIAASQGWKDSRNDPTKAITHGDGSPLNVTAVRAACEISEELSFDVPWQAGDVALVDNYAVMHARRPFEGTRRILASLVAS